MNFSFLCSGRQFFYSIDLKTRSGFERLVSFKKLSSVVRAPAQGVGWFFTGEDGFWQAGFSEIYLSPNLASCLSVFLSKTRGFES